MKKTYTLAQQNILTKFTSLFYLNKWSFFLIVATLLSTNASSQAVNTYVFTAGTGASLTTLTTPISLIGAGVDDAASAVTALPFTFSYGGTAYNQFSVTSNGLLAFGGTACQTTWINSIASLTTGNLMIFWDDLVTNTQGTNVGVQYQVFGTTPNRVLVINFSANYYLTAINVLFQCQLYEGTNVIKYLYGAGSAGSADIGIASSTTVYESVTVSSNTMSTVAANDNVGFPPAGTVYTFAPAPCSGTPTPGTAAAAPTTLCGTTSTVLTLTGQTSNVTGITLQWMQSTNGGAYTVIPGATTNPYTATGLTPGNTYKFHCVVTCSNSGLSATSTNTALVTPYSVASVSPTSGNSCSGSSVTLTASPSGASYSWNTGATTQAISPTTAGTYTVTVTQGGSCITTASAVITASTAPTAGTASASPNPVCAGNTLTLTSNVTLNAPNYAVSSIPYAPQSTAGATVLCNAGVNSGTPTYAYTGVSLDDGVWSAIPLGFSFTFMGTVYTTVNVGTNGNIQFGGTYTGYNNPGITMPTNVFGSGAIGAPWVDFDLRATGSVKFSTTGSAPNRTFFVNWTGPDYAGPDIITTQLILYETTNFVEVHFAAYNNTIAKPYTLGVTNAAGTLGTTAPGRNAVTTSTVANEGWRFKPSKLTYAWTGPNGFTSTLQNPVIAAAGPLGGVYTVTFTDQNGCSISASTANVIVNNKSADPTSATGSVNPICNGGSTALTLSGGGGGTGEVIKWYTASCGGTLVGTGNGLSVSPAATTTYYGRYEDGAPCSYNSACMPVTITVNQPVAITTQPANSANCNSNVTFTVTASGTATYQWQISTDGGVTWNNLTNNATYSGVTTNTLTIVPFGGMDADLFRVVVSPTAPCAGGATSSSVKVTVTSFVWTGTVGTNWNTPGSWSCGVVPNSILDNVTIPNVANAPIIFSGANFTVGNITIGAGGSLTNNGALSIAGTITNSGSFNSVAGTISLIGVAAQNINGSTFTSNTLTGLVINNAAGVTLGSNMYITDSLSVQKGNFNMNNIRFTFRSSASLTARLSAVTGSITNATNVEVERYYPAHRAWRLISVPVTSPQTIRQAFMDSVYNTSIAPLPTWTTINQNPSPGYGTHISGNNPNTNEFDVTTRNNPSMMTYVSGAPPNDVWAGIPDTKQNISAYNSNGYMLFVRGSRATYLPDNTAATPDPTVLRPKGTIHVGTQPAINIPAGTVSTPTFAVFGNPYPSPIDFHLLTKNNIADIFNVWDPGNAGSYGVGGWVTFTWTGAAYSQAPLVTGSTVTAGLGRYIQSGQAVLVQNTSGLAGSITVAEAHKVTGSTNAPFTPMLSPESFRTNLFMVNADSTTTLVDGTLTLYNSSYSAGPDDVDAWKPTNIASETISQRNGVRRLAIEARPIIVSSDTLLYNISLYQQVPYRFEFTPDGGLNHPGLSAFLRDNYLHTDTPLDLVVPTSVNFITNSDIASRDDNRFEVIFTTDSPLPVTITSIKAYQHNTGVNVDWTVGQQINMGSYEVEKSLDGRSFTHAGTVAATPTTGAAAYSWFDPTPNTGANYYRVKVIDRSSATSYTNIVRVDIASAPPAITVYPNPVKGNTFTLQLTNVDKGNYTMMLINKLGQVIYTREINHAGGSGSETITLDRKVAQGTYELKMGSFTKEVIKE